MKLRNLFLLCSIAFLTSSAVAQRNNGNRPPAAGADTSRPKPPARKPSEPKPYKEVITEEAKTQRGLFTVHKIDDKYFFEITDEAFNRDILVVSRLSKSGADLRANFIGYAGDQINNETIRFERGPNNKVFLRKLSFSEFSKDSTMPMYRAVMNSNVQPIAAAFDIKAEQVTFKNTVAVAGDNTKYAYKLWNYADYKCIDCRSYQVSVAHIHLMYATLKMNNPKIFCDGEAAVFDNREKPESGKTAGAILTDGVIYHKDQCNTSKQLGSLTTLSNNTLIKTTAAIKLPKEPDPTYRLH